MRNDKQLPEQPHAEEDLLARALEGAQEFLAKNWLHIILALAVVGSVVVAWEVYQYRHETHKMNAWAELGGVPAGALQFLVQPQQAAQIRQAAVTVTDDIVQNSPHTSATPWALLQLGSLQADGGDWTAAARAFSDLTTKYPKSQPVDAARTALAASLESLGKYKEAGDLYEQLAAGDQPYPLLSAARCRELSGNLNAAKQLYEKLQGLKTKDLDLVEMAAARLDDIALGQPLTPPPPVAPVAASVPAPALTPTLTVPTTVGAPPAAQPPAAAQ